MNPWYVVGLVVGIGLIVWGLVKSDNLSKVGLDGHNIKFREADYIPTLLQKMHDRLMKFAELRATEKLDENKFQMANELLADGTGVVKLEDQEKLTSEIKDKLGVRKLPRSIKGKKRLSKKLLRLSKEIEIEVKAKDKKWDLSDLIKIGECLDGQNMGVGELRDKDGKWQHWYKEMKNEKNKYNDDELDRLVSDHMFVSYGCCREWLYTVNLLKTNNEITEAVMPRVRSATANMLININRAVEEKTRPIVNRIQVLRSAERAK